MLSSAIKRFRSTFVLSALGLILWTAVVSVSAEVPGTKDCPGLLYRPKKDGIPVYESPDLTSKVLKKLNLGEKVCRIGEVAQFQILRWEPFAKEIDGETIQTSSAFARSVDLWEARQVPGAKKEGVIESAVRFFKLLFSGGMADDPLLPYRPIMTPTPTYAPPAESCNATQQESTCDQ